VAPKWSPNLDKLGLVGDLDVCFYSGMYLRTTYKACLKLNFYRALTEYFNDMNGYKLPTVTIEAYTTEYRALLA
jgi:hypothetical protein